VHQETGGTDATAPGDPSFVTNGGTTDKLMISTGAHYLAFENRENESEARRFRNILSQGACNFHSSLRTFTKASARKCRRYKQGAVCLPAERLILKARSRFGRAWSSQAC
jgi:hypothetical protein